MGCSSHFLSRGRRIRVCICTSQLSGNYTLRKLSVRGIFRMSTSHRSLGWNVRSEKRYSPGTELSHITELVLPPVDAQSSSDGDLSMAIDPLELYFSSLLPLFYTSPLRNTVRRCWLFFPLPILGLIQYLQWASVVPAGQFFYHERNPCSHTYTLSVEAIFDPL